MQNFSSTPDLLKQNLVLTSPQVFVCPFKSEKGCGLDPSHTDFHTVPQNRHLFLLLQALQHCSLCLECLPSLL